MAIDSRRSAAAEVCAAFPRRSFKADNSQLENSGIAARPTPPHTAAIAVNPIAGIILILPFLLRHPGGERQPHPRDGDPLFARQLAGDRDESALDRMFILTMTAARPRQSQVLLRSAWADCFMGVLRFRPQANSAFGFSCGLKCDAAAARQLQGEQARDKSHASGCPETARQAGTLKQPT